MPNMHRSQMNKIAEATADVLKVAAKFLTGEALDLYRAEASTVMARSFVGESSTFCPDRFRERCLGLRRGR